MLGEAVSSPSITVFQSCRLLLERGQQGGGRLLLAEGLGGGGRLHKVDYQWNTGNMIFFQFIGIIC